MIERNKNIEFLKYISSPLSKESILILYAAHNIKFERCELYHDFSQSLVGLIFDTYLGDDILEEKDKINHFRWCWKTNKQNFLKEGIHIGDKKLQIYFYEFMFEHFYDVINKNENPIICENICKLWAYIFDYNNTTGKTKAEVEAFIEIYTLFENTLSVI
jgi:hypothetical protein